MNTSAHNIQFGAVIHQRHFRMALKNAAQKREEGISAAALRLKYPDRATQNYLLTEEDYNAVKTGKIPAKIPAGYTQAKAILFDPQTESPQKLDLSL